MEIKSTPGWSVSFEKDEFHLRPIRTQKNGWYELNIAHLGDPLLLDNPILVVHFYNDHSADSRSFPLSITQQGMRVIFHVEWVVSGLTIHLSRQVARISEIKFQIRQRSAITSLWSIMWQISRRDKSRGINPIRIYAKSRARYKKHGYSGYLQRLLKEYHLADTHLINEVDLYQAWIFRNENITENYVQSALLEIAFQPKISILLPAWRSDLRWLEAAILSVKAQSYPNWELCIADDASGNPDIINLLQAQAYSEQRIKLVFRSERGQISTALNSALSLASGAYVCFLDHDDLLSVHAVFSIVESLQVSPRPRFLYSDEDKIDGLGRRVSPHFKSDWNPDLLHSQNYITHLMVALRDDVLAIGGFRDEMAGSQDHDLALRLTERLSSSEIVHIPRVLYHWRITSNSTALHAEAKPYTESASIQSLTQHFARKGERGVTVTRSDLPNTYRVQYPLPDILPLVSIIIPTRDNQQILRKCVNSLLQSTEYKIFELLIIDNGSKDIDSLAYIASLKVSDPRINVYHYDIPFNYSALNNYGVSLAKGSILCFLNDDIEVINPGWLCEMVSHASRAEIGCVGAKLYFPDKTIQHAGVIIGIGGVAGHSHKHSAGNSHGYFSRLMLVQNISAVTGACLVVRKSIFEEVGGLNEVNLKIAFNDVDLCLKVREAGYRNLWTPHAELIHHESKSRGHEDTDEKRARFQNEVEWMKQTWGEQLNRDPYYNPNLTLANEDFSLNLYRKWNLNE